MANKLPKNYKFEFKQDFEEVNIPSFDAKILNGLLFKTPNTKGLVFYLHGNAGSLDSWGSIAKNYTDLGYDIFILDYRGFGKSEGEIENQDQVYQDLTFAYNKLITKYDRNKVVIIGYSIGTGLATHLASLENPKKLILQAPYYNFIEFSSGRAPFVPDFLKKFKFETNKYIVKVKSPIYIFHGNKDQVISFDNSIRLKKLLKPNDKVYILDGEDHLGINENSDFQRKLKVILE
ncbi:alpha/beta hydrolase [Flavobacterium nackdongense]|nr:alpha/beta fold hydrolase [Flavobacterium nackdongense]